MMPRMNAELTPIDVASITTERANWLWEHVRRQSTCFDDFSRDRGDIFAARLCSPQTAIFEYGDSGLILIENIVPKLGATIHFFVWDPRVIEGEIVEVGRQACASVFEQYELHRITAAPPIFNKLATRVATRVGFRYEGTLRQAFLFKDQYHDIGVYGLLAHEFEIRRTNG
jgi:RimJ/RimL family protein N-acetyltransferase